MFSHGKYNIEIDGNIIKVKLSDSFNLEGVTKFFTDIKEKILDMKGKPYFLYFNTIDFFGATPEAYREANVVNHWINDNWPPIYRVYVIKDNVKAYIAFKELPELPKKNIVIFNTEEEALSWLDNNSVDSPYITP